MPGWLRISPNNFQGCHKAPPALLNHLSFWTEATGVSNTTPRNSIPCAIQNCDCGRAYRNYITCDEHGPLAQSLQSRAHGIFHFGYLGSSEKAQHPSGPSTEVTHHLQPFLVRLHKVQPRKGRTAVKGQVCLNSTMSKTSFTGRWEHHSN